MCGMIGVITKKNIDELNMSNISALQKHRGPDEQNIVYQNMNGFNISLSHQRLSIVDLKNGQQPMYDSEENIVIVFNGEIYNHNFIRKELQDKGYIFKTDHSDTEVIIYAYKEWGVDCFDKFNGMWAISIIDKTKNKIILSRDRVGKKPLYYYFHDNELIFASELKVIKKYFKDQLTISKSSIIEYLEYGYIHSPYTIYKEVKKVKPAYYLEFDINSNSLAIIEEKYWNFKPNQNYTDEKKWNKELNALLVDSVRLRLDADVEVGTFLSGGVDSALISSVITTIKSDITSYTIGFKGSKFDELDDAKYIAKLLNIKHKYTDMSKLDYKLWDNIISQLDEPFADASIFPTYAVSKLASKDLKVILSGDGGDEQFLGYPRYEVAQATNKRYKNIFYLGNIFTKIMPFSAKGYKFATYVKNSKTIANIYNSILKDSIVENLINFKSKVNNPYKNCQNINDILFNDLSLNMSDQILTKVDRMSMLNSLEIRSPLLDYRIIEHVFSAPLDFRYKNNDKKYALKQLAIDFNIPKNHIYKSKRGFNAPINEWLQTILKNDVYKASKLKYINSDKYLEAVELTLSGKRDYFVTIFRIVLLYKWLEKNG